MAVEASSRTTPIESGVWKAWGRKTGKTARALIFLTWFCCK